MIGYAVELRFTTSEGQPSYCIVELKAPDSDQAVFHAQAVAEREYPGSEIELSAKPYRFPAAPRRPRLIRPMRNVI